MARKFSGSRLRAQRVAAGLSPEQLALRIDRSVYSVHVYEQGRARPSVGVLGSLADCLDCPVDAFFAELADVA